MKFVRWLRGLFGPKKPTPTVFTTLEACQEALGLLSEELLARKGVLPADLSVITHGVFSKLHEAIRDADTPANKAEMASALQGLLVGLHWMRKWMEEA